MRVNRLVTHLALAMLAVAVLSTGIIILSQRVGGVIHFRSLPPEVQAQIQADRARREAREAREARERTYATSFRDVQHTQTVSTWVGLGIAGVVAVSIAVLLARSLSRPIARVSLAAAKVAEGDLSARVPELSPQASNEAKSLSHNFNVMATSLERYENERKAMIADIAHELRTPLTAMMLRLEALADGLVPFDQSEVTRLTRQTNLLSRLIQDLRTLSLADAGQLSLRKRKVNLVTLMQSVLESYQARADKQSVSLVLDAAQPVVMAVVDPDRISQVVNNLLDNALRVTPESGEVRLFVAAEGDCVRLCVSDTGPGLTPDSLAHVFDRFFQNKDTKGTSGLGLAIVHTLVKAHDGQIEARNGVKGAQFDVRLPALV